MSVLRTPIDLRLAIILLVLIPLLSVFGVGGSLVFAAVESRLEARLQEDIALIARSLKQPMSRAVDRDRDVTRQASSSAYEFGRVYGIYVYDTEGTLISSADRLGGNSDFSVARADMQGLEQEKEIGDYRSMGGQEVFSYFTPLTGSGGQVVGMLQVTRQVSEMRDYISKLRQQALIILLAFSIVLIGIVIVGHHLAIGRPLARLAGTMDEVAGGDSRVRAKLRGPKEMQMLGRRFNLMLEGIRERDDKLHDQHRQQALMAERLKETEKYALAGRLAAGVAHELGTPLSVVDGQLQRLLRDQRGESPLKSALTDMQAAARRMSEVIAHLLGLGHALSVPKSKISVARLIRLAYADVRARFDSRGTALELSLPASDAAITGDESRLREALTHLLNNAMHAAEPGRVRLCWRPTGDRVDIIVEDSGPGIAAPDRSRIFEPFFTTKPAGEGSGLGLAVVQGIIADHDGSISVGDSDLGGAAFTVSLQKAIE